MRLPRSHTRGMIARWCVGAAVCLALAQAGHPGREGDECLWVLVNMTGVGPRQRVGGVGGSAVPLAPSVVDAKLLPSGPRRCVDTSFDAPLSPEPAELEIYSTSTVSAASATATSLSSSPFSSSPPAPSPPSLSPPPSSRGGGGGGGGDATRLLQTHRRFDFAEAGNALLAVRLRVPAEGPPPSLLLVRRSRPAEAVALPSPAALRKERGAAALQASGSGAPALKVIQEVGDVERHITVAFLSAGYVADDEAQFHADVQKSWQTLEGSNVESDVDPSPWPDYISTVNIYSLFQASQERGAAMPHGDGHVVPSQPYCGEKGCEPFAAENNLACAYGTPHRKLLGCDWERVLVMASYAPSADVIVVLVNHGVYGGTGDPGPTPTTEAAKRVGVATIYNGADLPLLMVHEVGHAFGGLSDEYSYGIEEPTDLGLVNCSPDKNKWRRWAEKGKADLLPSRPCAYTNYYRPTEGSCLMGAPYPRMCSVCKEQMVHSFYRRDIDTAGPRCPLPAETVVLAEEDSVTLRINPEFSKRPGVVVQWRLPAGVRNTWTLDELAAPHLTVRGSNLPLGDHAVTATTDDSTDLVLGKTPFMTSHSTFRLRRVIDAVVRRSSGCVERACAGRGWADPPYCSVCLAAEGGSCNISHVVIPRQRQVRPEEQLGVAKAAVVRAGLYALCGVAGAFLILVGGLLWYRSRTVLVVVILRPSMKRLRGGLCACAFATALGSVVLLFVSEYNYEKSVVFGKPFILAGMVLSGFSAVSALFLLAAAFLKVVVWLAVSAALFFIFGAVSLVFGVLLAWLSLNIASPSVRDTLQDAWDEAAVAHPAEICTFQTLARCSGFTKSCANLAGGALLPAFCPADCDLGNRETNSCFSRVETFVQEHFRPTSAALLVACAVLFLLAAAATVLAKALRERRAEMVRRRRKRLLGLGEDGRGGPALSEGDESSDSDGGDPRVINMNRTGPEKRAGMKQPPLTDEEIAALQREFAKVDKDGSGGLDKKEAMVFWQAALGETPTQLDFENASKAVDVNGDGRISFAEFVALYQPFDHRTASAASAATDPQMSGEVSPAEVKMLRRRFSELDKGCGVLTSRAQLRAWFAALYARQPVDDELEAFVGRADPDSKGVVDFKAFVRPYRDLRRQKARGLLEMLGEPEMCRLRREFGAVNEGGDAVLSTRTEFEGMYRSFHGEDPPDAAALERFVQRALLNSNGVVAFLDFCVPFARRARRRRRMRQGLDEEKIEHVRAHYALLEKTASGGLAPGACRSLYAALFDAAPTEDQLAAFAGDLDVDGSGRVEFDEVLRIFAEAARMGAARSRLQALGASCAQAAAFEGEFLAHSKVEEGLRLGVPVEGFAVLLRRVAAEIRIVPPTTQDLHARFLQYDSDGDGFLDESEFAQAYHACVVSVCDVVSRAGSGPSVLAPTPSPAHLSGGKQQADNLPPYNVSASSNPLHAHSSYLPHSQLPP
eukprot:Rhum_TRINITY_DN12117_c0_g1::Rhum_TRINITY_DN12117_c0_g1_i1::g.49426::m.49426